MHMAIQLRRESLFQMDTGYQFPEKTGTFAIKVYGCQMNVYDGDRLRSAMSALGWKETEKPEDADFSIFITCSIRDKAEQKVISELGRFRDLWEQNGRPRIALLGCMAQRTGKALAKKFPWLRIVAGPRHLGAVPSSIVSSFHDGSLYLHLDEDPSSLDDLACVPTQRKNPHKAYVTIAHGCDQFCSYCIVPYVRGRFGSRSPGEIKSEITKLVESGTIEITLLGQNVNTYGKDFKDGENDGYRFARLLGDIAAIPGLKRLRFTTSHPVDFTEDILLTMSSNANICPSINLPVQAGNDKVLREMNRKYTRAKYLDTVKRIREVLPGVGLTTDLIVGFPGETEAEFEDSVSLIEQVRFDLVHSAAYSPREGTPAATREDQVPGRIRAERLMKINDIQATISRKINKSLEGSEVDIILDEPAPKGEGLLQGRTATDKVVLVKAPLEYIGRECRVRIRSSSSWCLEGDLLS